MKLKSIYAALGLPIVLALSACASSPDPIKTYALVEDMPSMTNAGSDLGVRPIVEIEPVEMSAYLTGNGIVLKTSETQYIQAQNNIWVDDVSDQIQDKLVANMQAAQSKYQVLDTHLLADTKSDSKYRLFVYVSDFYGHYDGNAVLAGQWQIKDAQDKVVKMKPFMITEPLSNDGYDALVQALSLTVDDLSNELAASL